MGPGSCNNSAFNGRFLQILADFLFLLPLFALLKYQYSCQSPQSLHRTSPPPKFTLLPKNPSLKLLYLQTFIKHNQFESNIFSLKTCVKLIAFPPTIHFYDYDMTLYTDIKKWKFSTKKNLLPRKIFIVRFFEFYFNLNKTNNLRNWI